ncbi:FecR family protein [Sphingobacterium sp. HMA12]|uniref:FecR family protein n=1 Tax=Sphingobacterium sp. HMA12 TaxID=2050894 RepID=UPI000CEA2972|nr:FecR domain-containing protein [Sphingobacterium sp. HMA12]
MKREKKLSRILLRKYLDGRCTKREKDLVERWYADMDNRIAAQDEMQIAGNLALVRERLSTKIHSKAVLVWYYRPRLVAASILAIFLLSIGFFYLQQSNDNQNKPLFLDQEKAYIITGDGDSLSLTGLSIGQKINLNGIQIEKADDGEVYYKTTGNAVPQNIKINTPAAGQFKFILPDGSKIYLNASSSLMFKGDFLTGDRIVRLNGEAYFEVSSQSDEKRQRKPFIVFSKGQKIKVLGTHFNICSYDNDSFTNTTLIEGAVEVRALNGQQTSLILKPGQKVTLDNASGVMTPVATRKEAVVDWTSGYYKFENEKLPLLLKRISRWYDVDVVVDSTLSEMTFGGRISRKDDLLKAIEILEMTGEITIEIKAGSHKKKLIINPKTEK